MSDSMEVVHRLEREMADRASAVEKVDIFKTQIANAIDEHLRAIDRLCRFGIDGGFGKKHPVKEY